MIPEYNSAFERPLNGVKAGLLVWNSTIPHRLAAILDLHAEKTWKRVDLSHDAAL